MDKFDNPENQAAAEANIHSILLVFLNSINLDMDQESDLLS